MFQYIKNNEYFDESMMPLLYEEIPCNIKARDGNFYLVTSGGNEKASQKGFAESTAFPGCMEILLKKSDITGYKNFGQIEDGNNTIYWMCKKSKDDVSKMPSKLDYYRITKAEYENKSLLAINEEHSYITTMSVRNANNAYEERDTILASINGKEIKRNPQLPNIVRQGNERKQASLIDEDNEEEFEEGEGGFHPMSNTKVVVGIVSMLAILVVVVAGMVMKSALSYSEDFMDLEEYFHTKDEDEVIIAMNDELCEERGRNIGGTYYLPYDFVIANIDSRFYYDENEDILTYSKFDSIIDFRDGKKFINGKEESMSNPAYDKSNDGTVWINADLLSENSAVSYTKQDSPERISIQKEEDGTRKVASVTNDTNIRYMGNRKSQILTSVTAGTKVKVQELGGDWLKVSLDGITGYLEKTDIDEVKEEERKKKEEINESHVMKDGKICMVWHQIINQSGKESIGNIIENSKSMNVISPTWFYLNDSQGGIADFGNNGYVDACHQKGIEVWALINNLENGDVSTHDVLSSTKKRRTLIGNIMGVVEKYNLDGINIDFESLESKTAEAYLQFVRELSVSMHKQGKTLSVDNYVPSEYTAFYNREEQSKFVDYVVIMGYDEHTSSSKMQGSVASIGWVEDGVKNTLKEVPKEQVILGVPLYTRIWKQKDGSLFSETIGMEGILNMLNEINAPMTWDDELGQYYATFTDGNGDNCEVWVEEHKSMSRKLDLMQQYGIGGTAFWKSGLEPKSLWETINKAYEKGDSNGKEE